MLHPRKCSFRKFAAAASSRAVTSASIVSIRSRTNPELVTTTASTRPLPSREKCTCSSVSPPATIATATPTPLDTVASTWLVRSSIACVPVTPAKLESICDSRFNRCDSRFNRWAPPSSRAPAPPLSRSTYSRNARAVGTRPAEVCGCSSSPSLASSAISLRTVAELSPVAPCPPPARTRAIVPAIVPEPTGSPVSM